MIWHESELEPKSISRTKIWIYKKCQWFTTLAEKIVCQSILTSVVVTLHYIHFRVNITELQVRNMFRIKSSDQGGKSPESLLKKTWNHPWKYFVIPGGFSCLYHLPVKKHDVWHDVVKVSLPKKKQKNMKNMRTSGWSN